MAVHRIDALPWHSMARHGSSWLPRTVVVLRGCHEGAMDIHGSMALP